jgi:hypothetical protein
MGRSFAAIKLSNFFGYVLCFWITIGDSTFNNIKPGSLYKVEVAQDLDARNRQSREPIQLGVRAGDSVCLIE